MNWITYYNKLGDRKEVTFEQAREYIDVIKNTLSRYSSGSRIIVQMSNSTHAIFTYVAMQELNIVAVPVEYDISAYKREFISTNCGAVAIIKDGTVYSEDIELDVEPALDNISSTIIYTSGTTGQPKGVRLTKSNWQSNALSVINHHGLTDKHVHASGLPLYHVNAHGQSFYVTMILGSRYVLFESPKNARICLNAVNLEKVTHLSLVPSLIERYLRDYPEWVPHDDFKYIITAAAPLSGTTLKKVMSTWGCRIIQGYGCSESTNFTCIMPVDLSDEDYQAVMFPRPSIGVPVSNTQVKIENGELLIKSNSNFYGYWGAQAAKEWHRSGDLAYCKEYKGRLYYYIDGRIKEQINRSGETLSPIAIEDELRYNGFNGEFAVISIPDEIHGEEVAVVAVKSSACFPKRTNNDKRAIDNLAWNIRPKKVYYVNYDLPVTSTGKIQRAKLENRIRVENAIDKLP